MKSIPKSEVVKSGISELQQEQEIRYNAAGRDYIKAATDLAALKGEVLKSIQGESRFTPELLSELIAEAEKKVAEIDTVKNKAKQEIDNCKHHIETMQLKYDEVISWAELYNAAEHSAKKMIVANLINRIEVSRGYEIHIDFNIDLSHFNINFENYEQNKTA